MWNGAHFTFQNALSCSKGDDNVEMKLLFLMAVCHSQL